MRIFVWVILLLQGAAAFGQQRQLDSLLLLLHNHPQADTSRLDLLSELSFAYHTINPDSGIKMAREAIDLAQSLKATKRLPIAFNHLGINYRSKGEDTLALTAMEESLALYKKAGNELGVARLYNNLALIYYNFSDYSTALQYHDAAFEVFEKLDHKLGKINSFINSGVVYLTLANYPQALSSFLDAERLTSPTDSMMRSNIATNIGLVYKNQKDYEKSLEYQEVALALYQGMGNRQGTANALGNIATLYDLMGKPYEALSYYEQALELNQEIGDIRRIAADHTNIGVVYRGLSDYANALHYLKLGLEYYKQTDDKPNRSIALLELSRALKAGQDLDLASNGFNPSHRSRQIMDFQMEGLKLAEESGSLLRQSDAWEALSDTYQERKEYGNALKAYQTHIQFRDSIYNEEREREIIQKQAQFDYEKKEALLTAGFDQERMLNRAELARQRTLKNSVLAGLLFLLIAAIAGYYLYKKKRDAEKKQRESEFNALVTEVEMKALRSQMNPHFIFNSLNSISHFILKNDADSADYYLSKFSKLIRMILENSESKQIPLADDLGILKIYMELEAMRMDRKFSFDIEVDEDIDPEVTFVPPLLLQPFVENSIWHGISRLPEDGKIKIMVKKQGDLILFVIEDNGVGRVEAARWMKKDNAKSPVSMGIRITQDRINIINRVKNTHAEMQLLDLNRGLRVELRLPLSISF